VRQLADWTLFFTTSPRYRATGVRGHYRWVHFCVLLSWLRRPWWYETTPAQLVLWKGKISRFRGEMFLKTAPQARRVVTFIEILVTGHMELQHQNCVDSCRTHQNKGTSIWLRTPRTCPGRLTTRSKVCGAPRGWGCRAPANWRTSTPAPTPVKRTTHAGVLLVPPRETIFSISKISIIIFLTNHNVPGQKNVVTVLRAPELTKYMTFKKIHRNAFCTILSTPGPPPHRHGRHTVHPYVPKA
jgi:hypothetical protein